MKTKHTKGPWMLLWGNYTHFCTINKNGNTRVATIEVDNLNEHNGRAPINEAIGNSILMSLSPEMFDYIKKQAKLGDKEAKSLVKKYKINLKSRKF